MNESETMTREEALELLRSGGEAVTRWRQRFNPFGRTPALVDVDLGGCQLEGANLECAVFSRANFSGANLARANLDGVDFAGANLRYADLSHSRCAHSQTLDIVKPDLRAADLSGARISGAFFFYVSLQGAYLRGTDAANATLIGLQLGGATLLGSNLTGAVLKHTKFENVDVNNVILSETTFVDVNLQSFCRAEGLKHNAPSTVDLRSILRSVHEPRLRDFLRATGVPEVFIEYNISCAQSLSPAQRSTLLQSTFISYGGPDEEFACKLNNALLDQGVTTFLFKKDAVPGQRLDKVMRRGVNKHDRVILICSEASLDRPGVLTELTEILARESRDGGAEYLIPIRIDDYVFTRWRPKREDLKQAVCDRVVADFTNPANFADGVAALIRALSRGITTTDGK